MKQTSLYGFAACVLLLSASSLFADQDPRPDWYVENFNSYATNAISLGDGTIISSNAGGASIQSGTVRLTRDGVNDENGAFKISGFTGAANGWLAEFDLTFVDADPGTAPADGLSFNWGAIPMNTALSGNAPEWGWTPSINHVAFQVDTWQNGSGDNGLRIAGYPAGAQVIHAQTPGNILNDNSSITGHVVVSWNPIEGASMTTTGFLTNVNFTGVNIPGLIAADTNNFAFASRTGGANETVLIDNLTIRPAPGTPLTRPHLSISELVIDNTEHEDEHCQTPGWVELYNGTAAAISLNGWSLTDDASQPGKWPFPASSTIPAYTYLMVYFGHGTPPPTAPDTRLHTTFVPAKTGGFLGLYQGASQVDSFNPYPAQFEDVAYGYKDQAWTFGFLQTPTPGTKNVGLQTAQGPVQEEVVWPRDGGFFTTNFTVTLPPPVTPGTAIYYTLDNAAPTAASTLYTGPIPVNGNANIRAAVIAPGGMPGPVTSRTFLKLDPTLTNYRGTGQPFSSNLPVIVLDSFGQNIEGNRTFNFTYGVVLAPDPANGNRTRLTTTAPVDFQGRGATHLRGESSAGMPQKQYSWETHDNEGDDKDVSILGFPDDSDWVLYAPATDKTLLRNFIAYSSMLDTNGEGSAMRTKFVEVFFNQRAGASTVTWADYRGVYVLIEKIKRGNDRVDIAKLDPCDTSPDLITGGYVFKKDKASASDPDFTTNGGQLLQVVEPLVTAGDAQYTWLRNHVNAFEAALNGVNYADPVLGYRAYIEERTFMDNQWWVEIFKQIDGYRLSTYFTKDRGQKIKALPLWDYNLSGGNAHYLQGYNYRGWYSSLVGAGDYQFYSRLRTDPGYNQRHFDRYWQLRKSTFATPNIMARMDTAVNQVMDSQPLTNVTNGTGSWPNSTPSAEIPAARHHARWQQLGRWDWPNAPGYANRSRYASTNDVTDYTTHTNTPYTVPAASDDATIGGQGAASPVMSEVVHFKSHLTNRLNWIDNSNIFGTTILRPPVLSHEGGLVTAPYNLTISPYTGTAPPASEYGLAGTLTYASGTIFYTLDGTDPAAGSASVARNWVTDANPCQATIPPPPTADLANTDSTGKDWRDPDFNHSSPQAGVTWYSGINGVGYDDTRTTGVNFMPHLNVVWNTQTNPSAIAPVNASNVMRAGTVNGTAYAGNGSCYIRLPFTLTGADIADINKLRLYAKYDDGFIAYVNGVKIAERNAPASPTSTSGASAGRPSDDVGIIYEDVTTINNAAAIAALRVGGNVLSIHALNQGTTSNDLLQRFKLDGEISAVFAYSGPIVINGPVTVKARLLDNTTSRWSPMTEATYTVNTVPASATNIVVTEIMYNPPAPTPAEVTAGFNNDNMFEYLEVQNISTNAVDMAGVSFPNGFTFAWPTGDLNLRILGPGQRAVLVGHAAAFNFRYAPGAGVKVAGVFDGNLGNGGERLVMSGTLGVIKDFSYEDDPPFPVEADGSGYSLVLNNPAANPDHNLAVNWRSSYEIKGTPGTAAGPAGPGAGSALLDDDGDGMSKLLEFASGSSDNNAASFSVPVTGMSKLIIPPALTEDDYLTFSYTRARAADGFDCDPLVSTGLTGWQPLSTMFTLIGQSNNPDGTANIMWRSKSPASALPGRLFLQVKVTLNP